jgi:hypothetical protein
VTRLSAPIANAYAALHVAAGRRSFLLCESAMSPDLTRTPEQTLSPSTLAPADAPGPAARRTTGELPRRLGVWEAALIVIGVTIGSGIFRVPASVADAVGSPTAVAAVWVIGGIIALCGALSLAELAAAFPEPGRPRPSRWTRRRGRRATGHSAVPGFFPGPRRVLGVALA